jgi:hypothetical protein
LVLVSWRMAPPARGRLPLARVPAAAAGAGRVGLGCRVLWGAVHRNSLSLGHSQHGIEPRFFPISTACGCGEEGR